MKKTYEMKVNPLEQNLNLNSNNQNSEVIHKILEDPFIPAEVESYLNVKSKYNF